MRDERPRHDPDNTSLGITLVTTHLSGAHRR